MAPPKDVAIFMGPKEKRVRSAFGCPDQQGPA